MGSETWLRLVLALLFFCLRQFRVDKAGLELAVSETSCEVLMLLHPPPKCYDYRGVLPVTSSVSLAFWL